MSIPGFDVAALDRPIGAECVVIRRLQRPRVGGGGAVQSCCGALVTHLIEPPANPLRRNPIRRHDNIASRFGLRTTRSFPPPPPPQKN